MLFGIAAATRDICAELGSDDPLRSRLLLIEDQATRASGSLRQALYSLTEASQDVTLGVVLKEECRVFEARTGIRARVVVLGHVPELDAHRTSALVGVAREALVDAEKHSRAQSVAVSLFRTEGGLAVMIADDGAGRSEPRSTGTGLGSKAMRARLEKVGGWVAVTAGGDEGGLTVKAWVPCRSC
jgi:signal transduction histidine kinase